MRGKPSWLWLSCLLLLLINAAYSVGIRAMQNVGDSVVYTDAMVAPWDEGGYSYGTTVQLNSPFARTGTAGVAVTHTDADGAFSVHANSPLNGADYSAVEFWAYGALGGSSLTLSIGDNPDPSDKYPFTAPAGVWTYYKVLLSELGNPAQIERINWQDATGAAQPTYYLDDIRVLAIPATSLFPDTTADGNYSLEPGPSGVAVAPNGRIYAAVYKNDRVYSWPSVANMTSGTAPDKTFGSANGDPDTGCTTGPSATILCGPESVVVDGAGNLYVADTYNHRVVVFYNPDSDPTPLTADFVLGQPNLTSGDFNYDSNLGDNIVEGFCYVRGLAIDGSSNLWVVDEFNHRVVRFDTPLTTDKLPDRVLGQEQLDDLGQEQPDNPATTCTFANVGQSTDDRFNLPLGVAVDSLGNVFVTDLNNDRVQRFAAAASNGADRSASYTGLESPHDVAIDGDGNLYIADTFNNRVLVYAGGASGDLVADHTFPSRNYPMGMAFTAEKDFLLADCGAPAMGSDYPPCLTGPRGIYLFAAPEQPTPTATETATVTATVISSETPTDMPSQTPPSETPTTPRDGRLWVPQIRS
jgi:sugar lactone lactonase YvrE